MVLSYGARMVCTTEGYLTLRDLLVDGLGAKVVRTTTDYRPAPRTEVTVEFPHVGPDEFAYDPEKEDPPLARACSSRGGVTFTFWLERVDAEPFSGSGA